MDMENRKTWGSESWTRKLFGISVTANLILLTTLAGLLALLSNLGVQRASAIVTTGWLKPIWFGLAVIGTPLALFLWLGMLWHCTFVYKTNGWLKAAWLSFLILGNWVLTPLYYFLVYQRRADGRVGRN
jgi:hypothetical protein